MQTVLTVYVQNLVVYWYNTWKGDLDPILSQDF